MVMSGIVRMIGGAPGCVKTRRGRSGDTSITAARASQWVLDTVALTPNG